MKNEINLTLAISKTLVNTRLRFLQKKAYQKISNNKINISKTVVLSISLAPILSHAVVLGLLMFWVRSDLLWVRVFECLQLWSMRPLCL